MQLGNWLIIEGLTHAKLRRSGFDGPLHGTILRDYKRG